MILSVNGTLQFIADSIKEYLLVTKRKSVIIDADGSIGSIVNILACYLGNIKFSCNYYLLHQTQKYKDILTNIHNQYNHTQLLQPNLNPQEAVLLQDYAQEDLFPIRYTHLPLSSNTFNIPEYAPLIPFTFAELACILFDYIHNNYDYVFDKLKQKSYDYVKYGGISIFDVSGNYHWSDIEKLNKFFIKNDYPGNNNTSNLDIIQTNVVFASLNDDLKNYIQNKNINLDIDIIKALYQESVSQLEFIPPSFYYNFNRANDSVSPNTVP